VPGFTSWLPFWNVFSDQHRGTAEKTYTAPSHRDWSFALQEWQEVRSHGTLWGLPADTLGKNTALS